MKYITKFVNGAWVSFNTETYENTQVFYRKRECEEAVKKMNNNLPIAICCSDSVVLLIPKVSRADVTELKRGGK